MNHYNTYYCRKNCCKIKITEEHEFGFKKIQKKRYGKAGVFIFDPASNKVLIVQSRGTLWGLPKGGIEENETALACAIRETKEETGIVLTSHDLKKAVRINNRITYFYTEKQECDVKSEENVEDNDVNGLGWVNLDCLDDFIKHGNITLNHHAKLAFKKFLGKSFSDSKFIRIGKKRFFINISREENTENKK